MADEQKVVIVVRGKCGCWVMASTEPDSDEDRKSLAAQVGEYVTHGATVERMPVEQWQEAKIPYTCAECAADVHRVFDECGELELL